MKRQKMMLLFLLAFGAAKSPLLAKDEWMERFLIERREVYGPPHRKSTDDAKRFLLLEGKPKRAYAGRKISVPANVSGRLAENKTGKRSNKKKRGTRKINTTQTIEALLVKSREAFENGQLEKAKRLYGLVQKMAPDSTEAAAQLAIIEREIR